MPAAFIPIANCIAVRINAHFQAYPNVMNNVLHFGSPTQDPPAAECAVVAAFVNAWCAADYSDVISDMWTIDSVEAFSTWVPNGGYALVSTPCAGANGNTTQPDAAPLVMLKSTRRGRSYNGRFYALAPGSGDVGTAQYTAVLRNGLVAAMQALTATAQAAGFPLVVASPTLQETIEVTGFTTSARLTKQKRRRLGFGG